MCLDGLKEVSIHAPVKGRPGVTAPARNRERVSIHAPVKGRPDAAVDEVYGAMFQSTPP